ncbi:MAG: nitrous oxide reductase family maturation protein NosD [Saprospiraceae bacterium]
MRKLACISGFFFLLVHLAHARIIEVYPGNAIQTAIDKATPFDTVLFHPGRYKTTGLKILKPISIQGKGFPVLDGEMVCQPLSVESNYVSISGLKIVGTGNNSIEDWAAIKVYNSHHIYIYNNQFEANFFAVYLSNCEDVVVSGNKMQAESSLEQTSGNGVHAWKCQRLTIKYNRISGHRDGIYFEFVENSYVKNNHCEKNNRYGLHFMFSHDDHYEGNAFINNGAGVAVMYSRHVQMNNNMFDDNRGASAYGLLLKEMSDCSIVQNRFKGNTTGILMEGCTRSTLRNNQFSANGWAIKVQASCLDNLFEANNFVGNTFDVATNSKKLYNTFSKNYWDKYEGYDLNRDGVGDVPFRPVSLFSVLSEEMPYSMMLWRSFSVYLLDRAEKVIPSISPDNLLDNEPRMQAYDSVSGNK